MCTPHLFIFQCFWYLWFIKPGIWKNFFRQETISFEYNRIPIRIFNDWAVFRIILTWVRSHLHGLLEALKLFKLIGNYFDSPFPSWSFKVSKPLYVNVVVVVDWLFSNEPQPFSWTRSNPQTRPGSSHLFPQHHLWCSRCLHSLREVAFIRLRHGYLA